MAKPTLSLDVLLNIEKIRENLKWPDLSEVFPTNNKELHEQLISASEYHIDDLTGDGEIEFIIDRDNIKEKLLSEYSDTPEYLSPSEVKERIEEQLHDLQESTDELFWRISLLSTEKGLLGNLSNVETLLIRELIQKALSFGRDYGKAENIGYNCGIFASHDISEISGATKGSKTREAAYTFLNELLDENNELSIGRLSAILEADSKSTPEKYGKTIPEGTCIRYARTVKNGRKED